MLRRRSSANWRPSAGPLLLFWIILTLVLSAQGARSDAPLVTTNPDSSRTITWTFISAANLSLDNVSLAGGQALLPWNDQRVQWTSSAEFAGNGHLDSNLTRGTSGLELRANSTNHVADGDFNGTSGWTFLNGTTGKVVARQESPADDAILGYNVLTAKWDNFDDLTNWTWSSPPNTYGGISLDTVNRVEGTASMNMTLAISTGATWVSAVHSGPTNWSAHDTLVLWINATDVVPPLSFNITATVGASFRTTPELPLVQGWHETLVNITPLGTPLERNALQDVRFRINGQNVPSTQIYFDDASFGTPRQLDEGASISQAVSKPYVTSPRLGSGSLSFNWSLVNSSGVVSTNASVHIAASNGSFDAAVAAATPGAWQHFAVDISSATSDRGPYLLSFHFRVVVDNASESHANLRVDNVSMVWPDRHNGTYLSNPISLSGVSELLNVTWTAAVDAGATSARLDVRSGNGTDTADPSWSPWNSWADPGQYLAGLPSSNHFQVRAELNTTNASESPVLNSFLLEYRHRVASGTVTADVVAADLDFLLWRSLNASWSGSAATSVELLAGNGSTYSVVPPSGSLAGLAGRVLRWQAVLTTSSGLNTPTLVLVEATYEFLGPANHVLLTSPGPLALEAGQTLRFQASVLDAGDHPVNAAVVWSTTDPTGKVQNDGTYLAGSVGTWNVTVTVAGSQVSATAHVTVRAASLSIQAVLFPFGLVAVVAAAVAYVGYDVWVKRAFAIDDIFLISKDGRLMLHNTRRMRADRDEDILSAMLTAILTFLRDFDPEESGGLRRFDIGGKTALLERGTHVYLAAVYSGRVPRWAGKDLRRFMSNLETRFGPMFARWTGSPQDLQGLKEFSEKFVSRVRYRPGRGARRPAG